MRRGVEPKTKRSMRRWRGFAIAVSSASLFVACAQENPTDVGGSLLPGGVRTYEVILEAERFTVQDTSFGGFSDPQASGLLLLAESFGGVVEANVVSKITMPASINVRDATGNTVTDSMPVFFNGRLIVRLDTLASSGPSSAEIHLSHLAEDYDPGTANWTLRADTSGVQDEWQRPGGTPGERITTWTWQPGADSLVIPVDSANIAVWTDTLATLRGIVLEIAAPDTRLRPTGLSLQLDARSSIDTDTTVTVSATLGSLVSLITPLPTGTAPDMRVGGTPAWRGMLRLRERLDTLRIPCLDDRPGCSVPLGESSVTAASLLLEPGESPPGLAVESLLGMAVREMIVRGSIPLERSPLGAVLGGTRQPLRPAVLEPGPGRFVEVFITEYIRRFAAEEGEQPSPWIALTGSPEGATYGFATFDGLPRLRLIISVGTELQLR